MKYNEKLTVVHLISSLEVGGAETQLFNLVSNEKLKGNQHIVISIKNKDTVISRKLNKLNVKIISLGVSKFNFIFPAFKLMKIISNLNPRTTILQTWMYHANLLGTIISFLVNPTLAVVWNIRRTLVPNKGINRIFAYFGGLLSKSFPDAIVFNAKAAMKSHKEAGYCSAKFTLIYNAIDLNVFNFSSNNCKNSIIKSEENCECKIIGVVGRYAPIKGHINLFKSLLELPESADYRCILVGRGIEDAVELQPYVNHLNLEDRLLFLGECDNMGSIYQKFDFLVLPSDSEGFPNVVAEAMACGVPCIVTDVGDAKVIVDSYGEVVEPRNYQALSYCIDKWLNLTSEELKYLGEKSSISIFERFNITKIGEEYNKLYKSILVEKTIK